MIRKRSNRSLFFAFLISVFSVVEASAQISDLIYDPHDLWVIGEDRVLVNDLALKDSPISVIDFENDAIVASLRTGKGPGEVSSTFYKRITKYSNGDILLWDAGQYRITRYTADLQYLDDISGSVFKNRIYQAGLVNDSTLFTVQLGDEFLKLWRIRNSGIEQENLIGSISLHDLEGLQGLKNFTLLQTLHFTNHDGVVYMNCEYSSFLAAFDENGLLFLTDEPNNIPVPPHDEKNPIHALPDMGEHPEGARDVSVADEIVYVLLNGRTISKLEQMRYMINFEALIDKVNHAESLLMYDRITGEFLKEIELPIPTRQAKVQGEHIFLLNSLGDVPVVKKYKLSEL